VRVGEALKRDRIMAGMAGRYAGSYLGRCDGWRAAAYLD